MNQKKYFTIMAISVLLLLGHKAFCQVGPIESLEKRLGQEVVLNGKFVSSKMGYLVETENAVIWLDGYRNELDFSMDTKVRARGMLIKKCDLPICDDESENVPANLLPIQCMAKPEELSVEEARCRYALEETRVIPDRRTQGEFRKKNKPAEEADQRILDQQMQTERN